MKLNKFEKVVLTMRKFIFSLLLVFCLTSPCFAASWYWISTDDQGDSYFIDNASVQKNQYEAAVWLRINNSDGSVVLARLRFNHENRTFDPIGIVKYDSAGHTICSRDYDENYWGWQSITPDSILETIYHSIWAY
jgi:hypothetical protein